jgi:DNA-binding NtrC family response regulator
MGAKILLLTENSQTMAKLEMCLSLHGHEILCVHKLTQAQDEIGSDSTIDLVIADMKLSWGESFDLLKQIRADHLRNSTPFIFLCDSEGELTDAARKAAAIHDCNKFLFLNEFEPHRFRYEIEALLPEQMVSKERPTPMPEKPSEQASPEAP